MTTRFGFFLSLLVFWCACDASHSVQPVPGDSRITMEIIHPVPLNPTVDVVVVVDTSPSMRPKREILRTWFRGLFDSLRMNECGYGQLLNTRIAVITSNLGAGDSPLCASAAPGSAGIAGDRGRFQVPDAEACGVREGATWLEIFQGSPVTFTGDPADTLACIAEHLPTSDCPVSQPLAAVDAAFNHPDNLDQRRFLRSKSILTVAVLSDQDDCSIPADSTFFQGLPAGASVPAYCARHGHVCDGVAMDNPEGVVAPLSVCRARKNSACVLPGDPGCGPLVEVDDLANRIAAITGGVEWVQFFTVGGFATTGATPPAYRLDELHIAPVCEGGVTVQGETIVATPALRLRAFMEKFDPWDAYSVGICEPTLPVGVTPISPRHLTCYQRSDCLYAQPYDVDLKTTGVQNDCSMVLEHTLEASDWQVDATIPACAAGSAGGLCWRVERDTPLCPQKDHALSQRLVIEGIGTFYPKVTSRFRLTCTACPEIESWQTPSAGCMGDRSP